MKEQQRGFRQKKLIVGMASAIALTLSTSLFADTPKVELNIKSQSAGMAILDLAAQTDTHIVLSKGVGDGVKLPNLKGEYTLASALDKMLSGTGLVYEFVADDSVIIREGDSEENNKPVIDTTEGDVEEIVVTGSHLKLKPSQVSKQVITLSSSDLKDIGEPTLDRALARLPQNFGGLSATNTKVGAGEDNISFPGVAQNLQGGGSLNLRGLGPQATLILIDGRRMGGSGVQGGIQDISSIPMSAVERVEIIMDGASSIYGADAMGGAVNVILKKGAQDLNARIRYSSPFRGGNSETQLGLSWGGSWDSGRWSASIDHRTENFLMGNEQYQLLDFRMSGSSLNGEVIPEEELLNDGGRSIYSGPFASGDYANVMLASKPGFTGTNFLGFSVCPGCGIFGWDEWGAFTSNDFLTLTDGGEYVEGHSSADTSAGRTLVPSQEDTSGFFTAEQDLSETVNLRFTLLASDRTTIYDNGGVKSIPTLVEEDHPSNPFGLLMSVVPYYDNLPHSESVTDSTSLNTQLVLDWEVSENWSLETGLSYNRYELDSVVTNINDAMALWSSDWWDPFNGGLNNVDSGPLTDPFGRDWDSVMDWAFYDQSIDSVNETQSFDVNLSGSLFSLPAGDVLLSLLGEYGEKTIDQVTTTSRVARNQAELLGQVGAGSGVLNAQRDHTAYKAELLVPLFSEENAVPVIRELSLRFSKRYDKFKHSGYSNQTALDPEVELVPNTQADGKEFSDDTYGVSLVWSPLENVRFKANIDTAFITPSISELFRFERHQMSSFFGNERQPMPFNKVSGGNPDLKPEKSRNQSYGVELTPTDDLFMSVHWSKIEFKDKIAPFDLEAAWAAGLDLSAEIWPDKFDFDEDGNIVESRRNISNINKVETTSLDYNLRYDLDSEWGLFSFNGMYHRNLTHEEFQSEHSSVKPWDLVGIRMPKHNANMRLSWSRDDWYASLDANYRAETSQLSVETEGEGMVFSSVWQANAQAGYTFNTGFMAGTELLFGIKNLLNSKSEAHYVYQGESKGEFQGTSFRQTDPRGRSAYLQLTRSF